MTSNHILSTLLPQDLALLAPHLEAVDLPFRFTLESAMRPISHVYFLNAGLASVVASGTRDQMIEVGIIGRESLTGCAVLLGSDRSPNIIHMQLPGNGLRIEAERMRIALQASENLRLTLLRSVQAFLQQATQTALANGRATLDVRLARWLLMAHDRVDVARLPLTHEFLAVMLGVRRPGVTVALQKLEASGLVTTHRSAIEIGDRAGLEVLAGGFYGVAEAEQERLTGWRSPRRSS